MSELTSKLFRIYLSDWESNSELIFIGPETATVDDFHRTVDAAIETAVEETFLEALKNERFLEFYEIVHNAIPYLAKVGFHYVQDIKTVSYREGIISHIPSPEDMKSSNGIDVRAIQALGKWAQKVADYNDRIIH